MFPTKNFLLMYECYPYIPFYHYINNKFARKIANIFIDKLKKKNPIKKIHLSAFN